MKMVEKQIYDTSPQAYLSFQPHTYLDFQVPGTVSVFLSGMFLLGDAARDQDCSGDSHSSCSYVTLLSECADNIQ